MPIYEYECDNCGHRLEMIQRMSDAPATGCPECNKESLRKLVSAAGFRLKGTGWYETDFKNKPAEKTEKKTDKDKDKSTKKETKSSADSTSKKSASAA